jgi:hypothetical protein
MHHDKITQSHELARSTKTSTRIKAKCKIQNPAATMYSHLSSEEIGQSDWEWRVHNCIHTPYYFSTVIHMNCVHFLKFFRLNTNFSGSDKFFSTLSRSLCGILIFVNQLYCVNFLTFPMWNTNSMRNCYISG